MHKRALLACLLVVAMLLSGCSLVKKDLEVDAATPILTVNDKVFTKGEIQSAVNSYLAQMQSYYSQYYGQNIDVTNAEIIADAQKSVIDQLTEQTVVEAKAKELGFDQLSEEDQKEVDDLWQSYYDMIKSYLYSDSELSEEELDKAITADVTNYFGMTKESLQASKVTELLRADTVKDVTVSEDEIKAEFDKHVEEAKTNYQNSLSSYGSSFNNGSVVYYRPAGYRLVKQILTKFNADDKALMDDLSSKISSQNTTISSLQKTLTDDGVEDVDALLEKVTVVLTEVVEEKAETDLPAETETAEAAEETAEATATDLAEATPSDLPAEEPAVTKAPEYTCETTDTLDAELDDTVKANVRALKEAQEKLAAYTAMQTGAKAKAYANIDARADEILAEIAGGADWDTLMAEKTEDPGMQSGSTAETGYAVCENMSGFDSAFVNAAMALEKVGDTSDKIASDLYGYYIIKYVGDVEEGPVALEGNVYDTIKNEVQSTKEDEAYSAAVAEWVSAAKVTTDLKSLND